MRNGARGSQGVLASDPATACALLAQFVDAAGALSEAWDPALDPGYPRYLPSFDEFVSALLDWQEEVIARKGVLDDEDIRPVNFNDPVEVRRWLKDLRSQVEDAAGAGEDATRPLGKRALGRLMARRMVVESRHALLQLLEAAERGVG